MVPERVGAPGSLAVLCGPTAVGKTAVSLLLAEAMGAEIVAADSRTLYRGMDVGTAKPDHAARARVRHHLIDIADPLDTVTLARYQRLASAVITDIQRRGLLPLVVGGTGLYIRAIVDDLAIPAVPPNTVLRAELEAAERADGPGHLHARLRAVDPASAARIHPRNLRRLVRALEVVMTTGRTITEQQRLAPVSGPIVMVALTVDRSVLYRRIEERVDAQLAAGLTDEVRRLLGDGVRIEAPAMQGLGYKELAAWLQGTCSYETAVQTLKRNSRRYAKRQWTWFRRDPRVLWHDVTGRSHEAVAQEVRAIMDEELGRQRGG